MWALTVEAVLPFVDGAPHADGAPPADVGGPTDHAPPADVPRGPAPEVVRTDEGRAVPLLRGGRRRRLAGAAPPSGAAPSAGAAPPAGVAPPLGHTKHRSPPFPPEGVRGALDLRPLPGGGERAPPEGVAEASLNRVIVGASAFQHAR